MNRAGVIHMLASVYNNWDLIFQLARREILGRYRGSVLGFLWVFFQPLLMLIVYTFVFSVVFETKWQQGVGNRGEFAIILFCGLTIFGIFSETIIRSPTIVLNNVSYVKKVAFPLESLPWVILFSSIFHALSSLLVLIVAALFITDGVSWTVVFLPFVLIPLIFFTMGLSWFLASLGVYLRDISQLVAVATTVLLFMSPIFYPISAVPHKVQLIFKLNPLSFIIEESRNVLLWRATPRWGELSIYMLFSFIIAWLGYYWFQKTKKGFADVI